VRRVLPFFLMLAGCATLRALFREPPPQGWPERTATIPVPLARAIGVAYADFAADLEESARGRSDEDAGVDPEELRRLREVWACTDRPDFWEAWLYLDDGGTRYVVAIEPKMDVCFEPGGVSFGGGATYEIDAKEFTILKKQREE